MDRTKTMSVTDFKAQCLGVFDGLARGDLDGVEVTRHGKLVAVIKPPPTTEEQARAVHGCMKGATKVAPNVDLTGPAFQGE